MWLTPFVVTSGRWGVEAVLISIHKWFPNSLKVIRGATYCESQFPKFLHYHPSLLSPAQWRRINLYANKVTNVILSLDPERLLFSPTMPKTVKLTFRKDLTVFWRLNSNKWTDRTLPGWVCLRGRWKSASVTGRIWERFKEFDFREMKAT